MTIIEVNFAGFQFTRCVPDVPGRGDRYAWHISRVEHLPRVHLRRFAGRSARRRDQRLRIA
jgi:hypothetical protein